MEAQLRELFESLIPAVPDEWLGALKGGDDQEALATRASALLAPGGDEATLSAAAPDGAAAAAAAPAYFAGLRTRVAAAAGGSDAPAVLAAGVRSLNEFVTQNATGPMEQAPPPLWAARGAAPATQPIPGAAPGRDSADPDERWVIDQLEVDGEDIVGRIQGTDHLLAALICLAEPLGLLTTAPHGRGARRGGGNAAAARSAGQQEEEEEGSGVVKTKVQMRSAPAGLGAWPWWAARALLLQQQTLAGRCPTVRDALLAATAATATWAEGLSAAAAGGSGAGQQVVPAAAAQLLVAAARLEAARARQTYGDVDASRRDLELAGAALGVEVSVTGALGRRTVHQQDPKAQLVAGLAPSTSAAAAATDRSPSQADLDLPVASLGLEGGPTGGETEGLVDSSEVYEAPVIEAAAAENGGSPAAAAAAAPRRDELSSSEQALLLGWAAQVKKAGSADDLQQWEMAPYVEAVLGQRRSQFAVRAVARLLKARHERTRGRTRERSLLVLEQLCAAIAGTPGDGSSGSGSEGLPAATRRVLAYSVALPLWPLLRKELAEHNIAMGFVGAALSVYESLEMWDQLIVCYQLLGKKQLAMEVVSRRLEVTPDDPKLWCALGDVTGDPTHYETAWQRSNHRSARAQRSLARAALKRKEWAAAADHFEPALALSPLHPDCWFSLGYCYLRTDRADKARQAFTKLTQLEPDHGEGWANLAALWLQAGQWQQALSASEQTVRHKRDSWQAWENYAQAALRAGSLQAAARAVAQVLQLSGGHRVALPLLAGLMEALEKEGRRLDAAGTAAAGDGQQQQQGQQQEDEEEGEVMEAPGELLQMLALESPGGENGAATGSAAAAASQREADVKQHAAAVAAAGAALKAVANSPSCSPEVWGLLGRWYLMQNELTSAKEAHLKHVRALQGAPFARERPAFEAMAGASLRLADAYLRMAEAGAAAPRDLGAGRMHLRGVVRQAVAEFGESPLFGELEGRLAEIEAAEARLKAAAVA